MCGKSQKTPHLKQSDIIPTWNRVGQPHPIIRKKGRISAVPFNALDPIGATSLQDDTGKVGEPAEPTIQFTSANSVNLLILSVHLFGVGHGGAEVFAVHLGDVIHGDTLRACGLAFVKVRAVAEAFLVHLGDHGEHALLGLDPMTTVRARRIKKNSN